VYTSTCAYTSLILYMFVSRLCAFTF
jgi:hypothetical protein